MTSTKYIGMDVHKEHADFPIMPTLGKSQSLDSSVGGTFTHWNIS
jgi:hypothetical protein